MKKIATIIFILCVTVGCHSVRRGEPITGPITLNPKQEAGRIVFQQRCHQCHPYGGAGLGPAINNKPAPAPVIKTQVRAGLGAMPRFDEHIIPETDLDDLMSYIIALRKADKDLEDEEKPANRELEKPKRAIDRKEKEKEKPIQKPEEKEIPIKKRVTPLPPRQTK